MTTWDVVVINLSPIALGLPLQTCFSIHPHLHHIKIGLLVLQPKAWPLKSIQYPLSLLIIPGFYIFVCRPLAACIILTVHFKLHGHIIAYLLVSFSIYSVISSLCLESASTITWEKHVINKV